MNGAFKQAMRDGVIRTNPWASVDLPTVRRKPPTIPSSTEIGEILAHVDDAFVVPIRLLAGTGMRRSEALALKWSDYYPEGGHERCALGDVSHVHVNGSLGRMAEGLVISQPKTEHGRRAVPLSRFVVRLLATHREEQDARRELFGREARKRSR